MAKTKAKPDPYAKRADENHFEWRSRVARLKTQRDRFEPIVTPEALRHGNYESELVLDPETGKQDAVRTMVNRGGTPLCRWVAQKRLSETQERACGYMARQWEVSGHRAALTASYGERIAGMGNSEERSVQVMEATDAIARAKSYVPRAYYDVFENVVRFGIAAGTAGETLGHASRNAKHSAYLTVCFVADVIAMKEGL